MKVKPAFQVLWILGFGCWALVLSGVLTQITGSPGTLQLIRLQNLLYAKQNKIRKIQDDLQQLEKQASLLEKNKVTQVREIRRVLGYAAEDELIFNFEH